MARSLTRDQLCLTIATEIAQWNNESLETLACRVLVDHVRHIGDGIFKVGDIDDMRLKPKESP